MQASVLHDARRVFIQAWLNRDTDGQTKDRTRSQRTITHQRLPRGADSLEYMEYFTENDLGPGGHTVTMHSYSEMQSTPLEQLERDFGLRVAAFRCDVRGVRRYLRDGASVNAVGSFGGSGQGLYQFNAQNLDGFGRTPLILACRFRMKTEVGHSSAQRLATVSYLLDKGADVNLWPWLGPGTAGGSGVSALDAACRAGHLAVVEILLERGADVSLHVSPDVPRPYGTPPLLALCITERMDGGDGAYVDLARLLLLHGADVNQRGLANANGDWTPLHAACAFGYPGSYPRNLSQKLALTRYLLDNGADVTAVNSDGNTPLDLEMKPCMKKLFRKHFAILVRRCAFRGLPADLASHVASFLI